MGLRIVLAVLVVLVARQPLDAQGEGSRQAPDLSWNQWRGALRDGLSPDTGLLKKWPAGGPRLAWKVDGLGAGFSSVSFAGDLIFTLGDRAGGAQLMALERSQGKLLWTASVGPPGGRRNPGPRSTPATDGKLVFALGHDGSLVCVDARKGKVRWRRSLARDFGGRMMSGWGYSESPLLDGDLLVCTPGGRKGAVIALQKTSGKLVWRCRELVDDASYASLVPVVIKGVRQYLVLTAQSIAGIRARDGKLLWQAEFPGRTAVCATPVYQDGLVFATASYGVGCSAYRITRKGRRFLARQIYAGRQLQNHHGGVVCKDGYVYGIGRRDLKCIELKTGKVMWQDRSVGKGSITYAGGRLIVRGERRGTLALVEATPRGYREEGRFEQPDPSGEPAWAHPVVFRGHLYIRDQGLLLCYDLRGR